MAVPVAPVVPRAFVPMPQIMPPNAQRRFPLVNSTTVLAAARPFEPDDREYDSCSHGDPRHPEMVRQRRNVIDVCAEEKSQQAPDQHPERAA
jgi:hypothetical protein